MPCTRGRARYPPTKPRTLASMDALQQIAAVVGPLRFPHAALRERFRRRELPRGARWYTAGEVPRTLAYVERGLLWHYRVTEEGRRHTHWATLPGQFACLLPAFTRRQPSEDTVEAAEPTVLHELDRTAWADLRAEHPQLQQFWVAQLEWLVGCFDARVWSLIQGDAERRYRYMLERYPDFVLNLPQHYLADMLGISPRHLSRIRAKVAAGSD